ncbi:hypothetical protein J7J90_00245 [Candidatus Micrarchaeota archaeon]|nr:hypothetical protein [Candidatus Micrarchaeota archaeon]
MDIKTFRLGVGFAIPATKKGACADTKLADKLQEYVKEDRIDENCFSHIKMFNSFIEKIGKQIGKEPLSYDVINAYITGEGILDVNGSEIISKMIKENVKLNIHIPFSLPPTHNSYVLCIAKIYPHFNDCMVRPATVLDDKRVIFFWRIGREYNIEMGETQEVEFLPSVTNVKPGDIVLVHYGEAFWKADDKQLKTINENINVVCKKFRKIINK